MSRTEEVMNRRRDNASMRNKQLGGSRTAAASRRMTWRRLDEYTKGLTDVSGGE